MQEDGKEFLKALQDRSVVRKFRSFQFCQRAQGKAGEFSPPPPQKLSAAAAEMRPVFEGKKRGDDCEVSSFDEGHDEVWFVIRRGKITDRGENIEDDWNRGWWFPESQESTSNKGLNGNAQFVVDSYNYPYFCPI